MIYKWSFLIRNLNRSLDLYISTCNDKRFTPLCVIFPSVNLAHEPFQGLQGTANMSEPPHKQEWSAQKAVDGNTAQETLTTCAIMDWYFNYKSVWWKVRLGKRFNVAYLDVFFRNSSMFYSSFLLALFCSIQK